VPGARADPSARADLGARADPGGGADSGGSAGPARFDLDGSHERLLRVLRAVAATLADPGRRWLSDAAGSHLDVVESAVG
jgi:hypothetical protein